MSLEADARAAALANVNIAALIGSRFYPSEAPQEAARPLIAYNMTSNDGDRTLGGVFVERLARYQWRLVCDSYEQVIQLCAAVLELAGTGHGDIAHMDIRSGPDGYDFETKRYIRVMEVVVNK
jgi:hypothetical protein